VVAVVSQPDRPRGRGRHPSPSPVAALALRSGIALLRPERVGEPETLDALRASAPDLGVVVAFGQFLPKAVRELPSMGYTINGHASLLPALRGAAPIPRAILAGMRETGISVMRVEREMDGGPVAFARATPIGEAESAGELEARLAELAAEVISEAVEAVAHGSVRWTPQDEARASFAPKLEPHETWLDFREPAPLLVRRVRALSPRPGSRTTLSGETLRILAARALSGRADALPGTVRLSGEPVLRVATGDGWLVPLLLQRAGGRPLAAADFLRGRAIADGAVLGGAEDASA
jgi:methionyl-tRNA formyltransferase